MLPLLPSNNTQKVQIKLLNLIDLHSLDDDACFSGWSKFALLEHYQQTGALGFVAMMDKQLIGLIFARIVLDESEILTFEVKEVYREQGVGKRLLQNLLNEIKRRGARKIFLEVNETNFKAIRLYIDSGFSVISKRHNYYSSSLGQKINALVLEYTVN